MNSPIPRFSRIMTKESSEILLDHASCSCLAKESCKKSLENIDFWGKDNYTEALLASMDEDYDGSSVGLIIKGLGFCKEVSGKTAEQHLSRENLRKILDGAFVSNNMSIIDHTMEFVKTIDDPSPFKPIFTKALQALKNQTTLPGGLYSLFGEELEKILSEIEDSSVQLGDYGQFIDPFSNPEQVF